MGAPPQSPALALHGSRFVWQRKREAGRGEGVSRRRSHCPERGRGVKIGGGGAGGPRACWGGAPAIGRGPRSRRGARGPRPFFSRQRGGVLRLWDPSGQKRERAARRGGGAGAAGASAPAPRAPVPGLAALRPEKFSPSSELRELRAPTLPPQPPPLPARPGWGRTFCARGS